MAGARALREEGLTADGGHGMLQQQGAGWRLTEQDVDSDCGELELQGGPMEEGDGGSSVGWSLGDDDDFQENDMVAAILEMERLRLK